MEKSNWPLWAAPLRQIVEQALAEDLAQGDVTTEALIPASWLGQASLLVKRAGVVAGIPVAEAVFHSVDSSLQFQGLISEGSRVVIGDVVATVQGGVASILKGERVALNFLQRLSGIATETARYVEAVADLPVRILDTRKTTPGLRALEKYAVRMGGGHNHRHHLGDGILIKDNHLAALRTVGMGIKEAIAQARQKAPHTLKVEVEVTTYEEAQEAVVAGADIILLDNMNLEEMRLVVDWVKGRSLIEASGGIILANLRAVAETRVDFISVGALTHSVRALDISLELAV
ncbi:MAG: carboxylating nicotinate-nucleotide diphosphorylase [Chloroflexi bacterium]|nr:carboxylating nicotinate-nucleotide diphosphorylase [Chloroflexota bacterium]